MHRGRIGCSFVLAAAPACSTLAGVLGAELVVNGDAETGSLAGWVTDDVGVASSVGPGSLGVPVGESLGKWCFHAGTGPLVQTMSQDIDLSQFSVAIDAGEVTATFHALLQSRAVAGGTDLVTGTLVYRAAGGAALATISLADASIVINVFDWSSNDDARVLPAGTRSAEISFVYTRVVGASTDAFVDNVSLVLADRSACPPDFDDDGVVDGNDLGTLLGMWGPCAGCAADFNGDGIVDGDDLGTLLGAWGPCP